VNLAWKEILTQILGFIILFWILKKFAWKPVLGLLEERQNKIREEFGRIEKSKEEIVQLKEEYERNMRDIEAAARQKMNEGIAAGQRIAAEIQEKARQDAVNLMEKARANIDLEIAKAKVQLKNEIVNLTIASTEKILRVRLDEDEQRRLALGFIDEIGKVR
jgi:F-type H+-transporting ATPase subunit b